MTRMALEQRPTQEVLVATQVALERRGIGVSLNVLGRSSWSAAQCFEVRDWAIRRGRLGAAPSWLRGLLERGQARHSAGWCKFCGCTWERACRGGCAWADRDRTICTQCVQPNMG